MPFDPMPLHATLCALNDLGAEVPRSIGCGSKTGWTLLGHFDPEKPWGDAPDVKLEFPVFARNLSNHQRLIHDTAVERGKDLLTRLRKDLIEAIPCLDHHLAHITLHVIKAADGSHGLDMSIANFTLMNNANFPESLTRRICELEAKIGSLPFWDRAATWHVGSHDICANSAADALTIHQALNLRRGRPPSLEEVRREPM